MATTNNKNRQSIYVEEGKSFTSYIEEGNKAYDRKDFLTFKRCYESAIEILERKLPYLSEVEKEKVLKTIKRIRNIADQIKIDVHKKEEQFSTNINNEDETNIVGLIKVIKPEDVNVSLNEIYGFENAKEAIHEYVIGPITHPEAYRYDYGDAKGLFLAGPPGTGKTTFAKAVAKEAGVPFMKVEMGALVNALVGQTPKNIDAVFAYAQEYAKSHHTKVILFFDEFEDIGRSRESDDKSSNMSVPSLLRNMEGIESHKDVVVIAASNYANLIDKALIDRFEVVNIPLPDYKARKSIILNKFKDLEKEYLDLLDIDEAARISEGMGGRKIHQACVKLKYHISKKKENNLLVDKSINDYFLETIRKYSE